MPSQLIDLTDARNAASVFQNTRRSRPRFFDGKFLTAADLMQEQNYLLTRQSDLARTLGFGVVSGLVVQHDHSSAAALTLTAGHGLTPSGDIVFLAQNATIDLTQVPTLIRLNAAFGLSRQPQPPFNSLQGLFVLGLRAVEFTANPTPVYPASVDGNNSLRDGEIIEATAVTLVPYDSEATRLDPAAARARAAREIFLDQQPAPLPANVLPIALLYLRNGVLEWTDPWLVRREAGDDDRFGFGFAPRALAEAHFFHYKALIENLPSDGVPVAAHDLFEILPPAGPLPPDALNRANFTQSFFPTEARVELALIPDDELVSLIDESLDLPPVDLSLKPEDNDALALLVLVPIPRANFGDATLKLGPQKPILRAPAPSRLGQSRPIDALLQLDAAIQLKSKPDQPAANDAGSAGPDNVPGTGDDADARTADAAWSEILAAASRFWFVRRRNIPDSSTLAAQPLAVASSTTPPTAAPAPPGGLAIVPAPDENTNRLPADAALPSPEEERTVANALASEGLWGSFAFLRAIADSRAHVALARLLGAPLLLENPVLQHVLVNALDKAVGVISESPIENFEQIQKDPAVRVLTEAIVRKVGAQFARRDVLRTLRSVFKDTPSLLDDRRQRAVLGRSNVTARIVQLAAKAPNHPDLRPMAARVQKFAATGRAQGVIDSVERTAKKILS
jgi:hypothetical protein